MYAIHYKLYGLEINSIFKNILDDFFNQSKISCNNPCDPNIICSRCFWLDDGVSALPDMYDGFWTTYSGDTPAPVVFGIEIMGTEEFNLKGMQDLYNNNCVISDDIKNKYWENFNKLPEALQFKIKSKRLEPKIIFARGTS